MPIRKRVLMIVGNCIALGLCIHTGLTSEYPAMAAIAWVLVGMLIYAIGDLIFFDYRQRMFMRELEQLKDTFNHSIAKIVDETVKDIIARAKAECEAEDIEIEISAERIADLYTGTKRTRH